jgi:hypothetical protein
VRNSRPSRARDAQWCRVVALVSVLVGCGCQRGEFGAHDEDGATPIAAAAHEALPRAVAGVSLGMSVAETEAKLGPLSCADTRAGYRVCQGAQEHVGDVHHLQAYVHRDRVISLSYDAAVPPTATGLLERLSARYGRPIVNGARQRDTSGQLHEVYGWKDDVTLYSVRLVWRDRESGSRDLVGTSFELWDRKGYQQWEAETRR